MVDKNKYRKRKDDKMEGRSFAYDEDSSPADISNGFYFRDVEKI